MPQRIPSPRELQYHTQSIMQNALIRKKLEEQRENFRKRQEAQQAQQQQSQQNPSSTTSNSSVGTNPVNASNAPPPLPNTSQPQQPISQAANPVHSSPVKHTQSPTPLAFTPTSVLRKMTADKGPEEINPATSIVSSSAGSSALLNSIANAGANKIPQNQQQQRMPQNAQQLSNQAMANLQIGQPIRGVPQRNPVPPQQQPPQVPLGHQHMTGGANMAWLQQQMQAQAANQLPKPPGEIFSLPFKFCI